LKNTEDLGRFVADMPLYLGKDSYFLMQNHEPKEDASWKATVRAMAPLLKPVSIADRTLSLKAAVVAALDEFMVEAEGEIALDKFTFYMAYSSTVRFLFGYVQPPSEVEKIRQKVDNIFKVLSEENPKKVSKMGRYLEALAREVQENGAKHAVPDSTYSALKKTAAEHYDDQWLRDQLKTMIWGSFETTQSLTGVLLFYAARYPRSAYKVREAYLNIGNRPPEEDPTILAFINEALRLNPPISYVPRIALRDFKLGNFSVPKGTTLLLNIFSAHHRKDVWGPDRKRFRPDRLDAEGCSMDQTRMIIPFGEGPRRCIGKYVALGKVAYVLGEILARYQIKISALDFPFKYTGNLRATYDGRIRLKPRDSVKTRTQEKPQD